MSAHTPSPWHTEGVFLPGTPDAHVTVWSAPQPGFQSGDEVAKYVHPRDARLIAAAPELLAALKEIADGCVAYRPGHVNYSDNRTKEEIRLIADAAIARATEFPS